jgi:hypothetical protein
VRQPVLTDAPKEITMPVHSSSLPRVAAVAVALGAALFAGCSTPYSQLLGYRYYRTPIDTYPVSITRVDDRGYARLPVLIEPGSHQVTVQAPPAAGFAYGNSQTFTLDVKPCTRYYLVAVKSNRLSQEFTPRVDYEEPVAGCKPGA